MRAAQARGGATDRRYDRACLRLAPAEVDRRVAGGEPCVVRLKARARAAGAPCPRSGARLARRASRVLTQVPIGVSKMVDEVQGPFSFRHAAEDDTVLLKSDGFPTYARAAVYISPVQACLFVCS